MVEDGGYQKVLKSDPTAPWVNQMVNQVVRCEKQIRDTNTDIL
jgi:hypothetical protein